MFAVILHGKEDGQRDEFFTPQNEIVGTDSMGVWKRFPDASKAAMRARLQDRLDP